MAESSVAEDPNFSSSYISSVAEEPLISASMDDEFSNGEETTESVGDEIFDFGPTFTSTSAKKKRKPYDHESSDSSMGEEPLWLWQNASMEEHAETSEPRDSEEDDDKKNGDKLEGNSSTNCEFSYFKDKTFFLMFEDDGSRCKNIIVELGGRVEEFFDVQKVTDLVVNNRESVGQPSSPKFNKYSRGQRAINRCVKKHPPGYTYDAKIVDISEKNNISVHTKESFFQLTKIEKQNRDKHIAPVQRRRHVQVRKLRPPFIKVEDQSGNFCPIFKEFDKWPSLGLEEDPPTLALGEAKRMQSKIYCEHCAQYVLKSQLEIHCSGERHKSIVQQPGYWSNVDELISKFPPLI